MEYIFLKSRDASVVTNCAFPRTQDEVT